LFDVEPEDEDESLASNSSVGKLEKKEDLQAHFFLLERSGKEASCQKRVVDSSLFPHCSKG
jgi:hypothetical protein